MSDKSLGKSEVAAKTKTDSQKSESFKPNKSTLYTIVKTVKPAGEAAAEVTEEMTTSEEECKVKKNVSTLYRIVSSQNMVVKPLETVDDGIEYENVLESQDNQSSFAENSVYYVDDAKPEVRNPPPEKKKSSELKKASVEIRISSPVHEKPPRIQSVGEKAKKPKTTEAPADAALGDLSSIRFSFLDSTSDDNAREFEYDTIDETKNAIEVSNREYMAMSDSSGTENLYSSPRTSLNSPQPGESPHGEYVVSDQDASGSGEKSDGESELFYAASEVLNLRPETPSKKGKESLEYEDLELENERLPEIPHRQTTAEPEEYADVDVNDYCRHREENPKKLNMNPKDKKAYVRVRSKINKAWKSMKNWINEERETKENLNSTPQRTTTIDMIKVIREDVKDVEGEPEIVKRNESPCSESPRLSFLNENINFIEAERRENSDCGTYVDMTRSQVSETSGFTLLRKRREGTSGPPSFRKIRCYPEVRRTVSI
ncbi:hypothetical protein RUM44_001960 [Polyplax serrata]|uniref:Uncharacterized protein n=1 Tax=Polyplax serrata TaxID=468196 RepID=A0ABR1ALJ0_POLSC